MSEFDPKVVFQETYIPKVEGLEEEGIRRR
jgi:hypothetical protein